MKDFKKLLIWEKGMEIVEESYAIAKLLPPGERYSITSQLTNAAISIPLNIAEGSSRRSGKDYVRFLEYALGSAFEVETIGIAIDRIKLLADGVTGKLLNQVIEEQKMIQSFISSIEK